MLIREPMVQATHFYLREAPGDTDARRRDRHDAFATDARRQLEALAGWLALPAPALPAISIWEGAPPDEPQPLTAVTSLQGLTNATAVLAAYALRNMLVLRLAVMRAGEHDQSTWAMLDQVLNRPPNTPTWLNMTRYWCGIAPRPPEDLEQERLQAIKTYFGVLYLGSADQPHMLVYPDARTQTRADLFLRAQAPQLDWFPVQARYRLQAYTDHASRAARQQQAALDKVMQAAQAWGPPDQLAGVRALSPLQAELDTLESTYGAVLADLTETHAVAQELHTLALEYRLALMRSGLWDAAPTIWEAQVNRLEMLYAQVQADTHYIDSTLRRMDLTLRTLNTRVALLQGERERLLVGLIALVGLALLVVLVADTDPLRLAIRLVALIILALAGWWGWRRWSRRSASPPEA
ncbi:MAG: hypothetical protein KBH93_06595 [Anaerolineae bacterium]|nr:hypothetical protein [Anaerolineae bacterium]